jgi:hypothetical protein
MSKKFRGPTTSIVTGKVRAPVRVKLSVPRDNQGETAASIRMRMAAHFPLVGKCDLAVVSDRVKHLIRLEIEGSDIARPSHHRPPDEAVHDLPT